MGPRTSLDVAAKRKIPFCQESNPGSPDYNLVTTLTELPQLPTNTNKLSDYKIHCIKCKFMILQEAVLGRHCILYTTAASQV
jgi:hypothetical protein